MKGGLAPELGCCYKLQTIRGTESSLAPSGNFQFCQGNQVSSAFKLHEDTDTVNTHGLSCASCLCPWPLAPAKPALFAYSQGLDLYLCTLQPAPLGVTLQGLRDDALSMKRQSPSLQAGSTDDKRLTAKCPLSGEKMGNRLEIAGERASSPPSSGHNSSSLNPWKNRKNAIIPLAFCPSSASIKISKELLFHPPPFYPAYPLLLPPSDLFPYGASPSVQSPHLFMLPPGTSCPSVAMPSFPMTRQNPQGEILLPDPGALPRSGQARPSQAQGTEATLTCLERAGMVTPTKQAPQGSRAGPTALPYPLKKQNGKVLYECNVCGKSFGQLSNLKVHLRVHSGERPFQCVLCKKSFTQLAHLQKHHLVHTGERPHKCQLCHKRFSSSSNLKTHQHLHSGAKPFQCDVCSSRFTQHVHLKLHRQLHTPQPCSFSHTHLPLASLSCLAHWQRRARDFVAVPSERKVGWDADRDKVSSAPGVNKNSQPDGGTRPVLGRGQELTN